MVELACMKQYLHILEYFIAMEHDDLPVWQRLMRFLSSLSDEECERAGSCLHVLLSPRDPANPPRSLEDRKANPYWDPALKAGLVNTVVKVIKSSIRDDAKAKAFLTLLAVISLDNVKTSLSAAGGIPALVRLLKSGSLEVSVF